MGLPFAPNSVPFGTNPGGKRLTTRIHRFFNLDKPVLLLAANANRYSVDIAVDSSDSVICAISIDPDTSSSWVNLFATNIGVVTLYGGMAIYGQNSTINPGPLNGIILLEHVYE